MGSDSPKAPTPTHDRVFAPHKGQRRDLGRHRPVLRRLDPCLVGAPRFQTLPRRQTLTITADCGGSNNPRVRLWKTELQRLADEIGLQIQVCHFPLGTSKWNKIEHRLFSFISLNWRGKPLASYESIIELIAATTTNTGLKVYARLDQTTYPQKVKITDEQLAAVNITGHHFHPEWNYTITPSIINS